MKTKKLNKIRVETHSSSQEVSTFLVGEGVELQVLHTKGCKIAQSWDYPVKPNGLSTEGAEDVLASFDFSEVDAERENV